MVGEPADIVVERLTWTAEAVVHVRRHGVTPADIDEVFANAPRYFEDLPGRSGTHIMLGPNASGRFLYVVIAPGVFEGEWVIVTAYPYSRQRALRHYKGTE